VSVASLGVLRALAASAPVIIAIDDVQWLDAPSARVLAFVVRRLGAAPIRILVALRVGSGGDPLALGRTGPVPGLHRVAIGPLREEAMTRLLRARTGGDLPRPVLQRAEEAGILQPAGGRIGFTHPPLGSICPASKGAASRPRRRQGRTPGPEPWP
jgi:hypothetical protein